jgi:hypothetical protein
MLVSVHTTLISFGECGAPHTSYTRQNNSPTTTNGDVVSPGGENGSSSSLVEDLRLTYGLSKRQCDTVVGYVLSHGQEYVQAKVQIVRSKPRRNDAGALLAGSVTTGSRPLIRAGLAGCQIARSVSYRLRPGVEKGGGLGDARARFAAVPLLW